MRIALKLTAAVSLTAVAAVYAYANPAAVPAGHSSALVHGSINVQNYSTEATINPTVNAVLQKEIVAGVERYRAKGGLGVIVNVSTGEIVAAVSAYSTASVDRITKGFFENAAALRLMTYAQAIEAGWLTPSSEIAVGRGVKIGTHEVRDFTPSGPAITATQAFICASNVAAGQISEITGPVDQRKFLTSLNQLSPIQTGANTTSEPLFPQQWRLVNTIAIGFGHGIANSPLHATAAVASLVKGGTLVTPTFQKVTTGDQRRVVSAKTSESVRALLKANVENGTAKFASIPGLSIGSVTATTEKIVGGHYTPDKLITSFMAVFPADKPQYVLMTLIDEPQASDMDGTKTTAASNAGAVGAVIVKESAPLLGVKG